MKKLEILDINSIKSFSKENLNEIIPLNDIDKYIKLPLTDRTITSNFAKLNKIDS